ncbi:hypothetical protein [Aeromicrobium sp. 179-A 4D2 NHS]|uniref:hypothetical protein n=1 Tax=Aeromicrobium sp. 179-A 4D2 NHS TaxID=3142375 RepID=UPI00399F09F9
MTNDIFTVTFISTGFAALLGLGLVGTVVVVETKARGRFTLAAVVFGSAFISCYATGFNPVIFLPVVVVGFAALGRAMWVAKEGTGQRANA